MYGYYDYTYHVAKSLDVFDALAWVLLGLACYGVARLWRGMRLDPFERAIRTLRQQPEAIGVFSRRQSPKSSGERRSGWLQISLLPLMLLSCGLAILLAQAQRPDDVGRPATWAVFVLVGTWYGSTAWSNRRGIGPLRNHALAGVVSAMSVSAMLWAFYLVVDWTWGDAGYERVTSSVGVLLWWTAVGGFIGGAIGSFRANRWYTAVNVQEGGEEFQAPCAAISSAPRSHKSRWSPVVAACLASLVFHLSAAPHIHRAVEARYWWHWNHYHHGLKHSGLSLTMTPAMSPAMPPAGEPFPMWGAEPLPHIDASNDLMLGAALDIRSVMPASSNKFVARASSKEEFVPIVLKRSVPAGYIIQADDLERRRVNSYLANPTTSLVRDPSAVAGMVTNQPIAAGTAIDQSHLASQSASPASGSLGLPAGPLAGTSGEIRQSETAVADGEFGISLAQVENEGFSDTKSPTDPSVSQSYSGPNSLQPIFDLITSVDSPDVEGGFRSEAKQPSTQSLKETGNLTRDEDTQDRMMYEEKDVVILLVDGTVIAGQFVNLKGTDSLVLSSQGVKSTIKWSAVDQIMVDERKDRRAPINWSRQAVEGGALAKRLSQSAAAPLTQQASQPQKQSPRQQKKSAAAATPAEGPTDTFPVIGDFVLPSPRLPAPTLENEPPMP